jgi:hypothetical protein
MRCLLNDMNKPIEISRCSLEDYNQILEELPEFWDGRDTRHLHHSFLIHELETRLSLFATGRRSSPICSGLSRRPSRLDMYTQYA